METLDCPVLDYPIFHAFLAHAESANCCDHNPVVTIITFQAEEVTSQHV